MSWKPRWNEWLKTEEGREFEAARLALSQGDEILTKRIYDKLGKLYSEGTPHPYHERITGILFDLSEHYYRRGIIK